jgi:hypothetical protein
VVRHRLLLGCVLCTALVFAGSPAASAVITPPTLIDGPSTDGIVLGNVAMAPDGTGGLVYVKTVGGKPHVFASRYDGANWTPPIRVDGSIPYEASEPRVAAGAHGRLLVVWVTQVATLANGEVRHGLYSAVLGAGAGEFGSPLLVDPNIKDGIGTTPSVAGTVPGKAIVAYRVITHNFGLSGEFTTAVQLRPGDVVADVRVARLEGDRWSRLGPINRNPAASMRPPTSTNGPQVAIGATGRAVVAWQEPDVDGTARIWVRRIAGTTPGPIFAASPETYEGRPVTDDATAFSLGVTATDRARVATVVDGGQGSPLNGQRVFLAGFGSSFKPTGAKPTSPELVDGAGSGGTSAPVGPPSVSVVDNTGSEGALNLEFASGGGVSSVGVNAEGKILPPVAVGGPQVQAGSSVFAGVNPEGGDLTAYQATDESGSPTVAVRQEFPGGELQTGLLYGPIGGSVSQLSGSGSGLGDALLAFCQGESGEVALVADRISAPPDIFGLQVPEGWVRPRRAKVRWAPPQSAVGGLTYELLVDGRTVRSGMTRRVITPPPALLGSGIRKVRVIATDRLGGEVLSSAVKLRVDAQPPHLSFHVTGHRQDLTVRLKDAQSGLAPGTVRVSFGDGHHARSAARFHHAYTRAGTYTVRVRARDRVGNKLVERFQVAVK